MSEAFHTDACNQKFILDSQSRNKANRILRVDIQEE